ncbi:MAG TPA: hypothetical protein VL652_28940 [Kutzneria sp.]|nr:hypothetical protein [Kutzneria sp.]
MRKSLLIPVCLLLAGCSSQTALRPIGAQPVSVAGRHTAELDVVGGASSVLVRSANLDTALYRAQDPTQVEVRGDVLRVSVRAGGPGDVVIDLNSAVSWRIALDGGATEENIDLSGGRLAELDLGAGAGRITAVLPPPRGTVPIRMTGGASSFDVRLPDQVQARVLFAGGAGEATIDGTVHTGIAGATTLATPGWNTATDRYSVENAAGLSSFTLTRT